MVGAALPVTLPNQPSLPNDRAIEQLSLQGEPLDGSFDGQHAITVEREGTRKAWNGSKSKGSP